MFSTARASCPDAGHGGDVWNRKSDKPYLNRVSGSASPGMIATQNNPILRFHKILAAPTEAGLNSYA